MTSLKHIIQKNVFLKLLPINNFETEIINGFTKEKAQYLWENDVITLTSSQKEVPSNEKPEVFYLDLFVEINDVLVVSRMIAINQFLDERLIKHLSPFFGEDGFPIISD